MKQLFIYLLLLFVVASGATANDLIKSTARIRVLNKTTDGVLCSGSGVLFKLDKKEKHAYILSCEHIIDSVPHKNIFIRAEFFDVQEDKTIVMKDVERVELVKFDKEKDLSLFRYEYTDEPSVLHLAADSPKSGERLTACGHPFAKFSALISGPYESYDKKLKRDVINMPPDIGYSGCGVMNKNNKIVGILTLKLGGESPARKTGAVSLKDIKEFLGENNVDRK